MPRSTLSRCVLAPVLSVLLSLPFAVPARAETVAEDHARTLSLMAAPSPESRQVSVTVRPGRQSNAGLSAELRDARVQMLTGAGIAPDLLRALADQGDGLAAQKYVRHLLADDRSATDSDIAYYATLAVTTGRVWTLPDAVAAMRKLDPATEPPARIGAYYAMLYPHAWAGNTLALDAVIDLNGEGRLFGPLSEATRLRILDADALIGDGRAVLRMALMLLGQSAPGDADMALARDYLTRAAASGHLAVQVTATTLLAQLVPDPVAEVVSQ